MLDVLPYYGLEVVMAERRVARHVPILEDQRAETQRQRVGPWLPLATFEHTRAIDADAF